MVESLRERILMKNKGQYTRSLTSNCLWYIKCSNTLSFEDIRILIWVLKSLFKIKLDFFGLTLSFSLSKKRDGGSSENKA